MLNIYYSDDKKDRPQSHEILMDDIYLDYTKGDYGGQIDVSLMAWGASKKEAIDNFHSAREKLIHLLGDQINKLRELDDQQILDKYPSNDEPNR